MRRYPTSDVHLRRLIAVAVAVALLVIGGCTPYGGTSAGASAGASMGTESSGATSSDGGY